MTIMFRNWLSPYSSMSIRYWCDVKLRRVTQFRRLPLKYRKWRKEENQFDDSLLRIVAIRRWKSRFWPAGKQGKKQPKSYRLSRKQSLRSLMREREGAES